MNGSFGLSLRQWPSPRAGGEPLNVSLTIFGLFFILAYVNYSFLDKSNPVRWILYLTPILLFTLHKLRPKEVTLTWQFLYLPFAIAILYTLSTVLAPYRYLVSANIREIALYAMFFTTSCFRIRASQREVLFCCIVMFVFSLPISLLKSHTSLLFDVADSDSATESVFGIFYAVASLYFFSRRSFGSALICVIFSIVSFKRNAWLGVIFVVGFEWTLGFVRNSLRPARRQAWDYITITALFALMLFVSFHMAWLFHWVQINFLPYDTLEHLSVGRIGIARVSDYLIAHMSIQQILFGYGPGYIEWYMGKVGILPDPLPHNEYKQFFVNYGVLGIMFFYSFIISAYRVDRRNFYFCIYLLLTAEIENLFYIIIYSLPVVLLVTLADPLRPKQPLGKVRRDIVTAKPTETQKTATPAPPFDP